MVCELCHMSMLWRNVYEKDAPSSCRLESGLGYKTRLRNVFFGKKRAIVLFIHAVIYFVNY